MSEQTESGPGDEQSTPQQQGGRGAARRSGQVARPMAVLESGHGKTTIADVVVTKVASFAALEVPGVYGLGGGVARAVGDVRTLVGMSDSRTQGVSVEAGEREAAVDLTLVIEYGESIPHVCEAVRNNVIKRVEGTTGLSVIEVNIVVNDLSFPGVEEPAAG